MKDKKEYINLKTRKLKASIEIVLRKGNNKF